MSVCADAALGFQGYGRFMPRMLRSDLPSPAIYHVTSRGVARAEIFLDDADRRHFVRLIERVARARGWNVPAYTLMPNHYHLLVETRVEELSVGMRTINGRYAQQFNERHQRVGHLFQGRFDVRVIGDEEHFALACEYVWNNPVRAGLCEAADDWPWSGRV